MGPDTPQQSSPIPRRTRLLGLWLAVLTISLLLVPLPPPVEAQESQLRLVGRLPEPAPADKLAGSGRVILIDDVARRLYYQYASIPDANSMHIREFDISKPAPKLLRDTQFAVPDEIPSVNDISPNTVALDSRRKRLYILTVSGSLTGCPGDPFCGSQLPAPVKLFVFDLKSFRRLETINVQVAIPGFAARGITYSEEDDRLYMAGELQPGGALKLADLTGAFPRTFPAALAALDAETQKMAWVKPIPDCDVPLATLNNGVAVRRSIYNPPALYFACARPFIYPGLSGIVRLWIDPKGQLADAVNFRLEYFPISGSYANDVGILGVAAFDYLTDRFYMQSRAAGAPGAWVFDGRFSAWVGFIVSPNALNEYSGLNQKTGRFYMAGGIPDESGGVSTKRQGYIVLSNGRSTPVPQGQVFSTDFLPRDHIYVDPLTRRLFVKGEGRGTEQEGNWLIFEDLARDIEPEAPTDYDSLTVDVPEGTETESTFAGDVQGWGARVVLVGGTGGLLSFCTGASTLDCQDSVDATVESVPRNDRTPSIVLFKGTRSLFASRVSSVDVRNVGSASSAQALALDPISDAEYREKVQKTARDRTTELTDEESAAQVEQALDWPHEPAACLDAQGEDQTESKSGQGGGSQVECDLSKHAAEAASSFGLISLGDGSTPARLSVGASSFHTRIHKDAKLGMVTETTAIAEDVSLGGAGLGNVTIGKVTATALTSALGRTGSAKASWLRTLEHVVVKSSSGSVLYECSSAKDCGVGEAIAAINSVLKTRIRVAAPEAELIRTPKGAFSSVAESTRDFLDGRIANEDENEAVPGLEISVYNDGVQRSRLVLQLAAIQSSSIYGISFLPTDTGGFDPGGPLPLPSLAPLPVPDLPGIDGPIAGPVLPPAGPIVRIGRTAIFLIRSPKQAFLFGLTTLLFAAAIAAGWRRLVLIRGLGGT